MHPITKNAVLFSIVSATALVAGMLLPGLLFLGFATALITLILSILSLLKYGRDKKSIFFAAFALLLPGILLTMIVPLFF